MKLKVQAMVEKAKVLVAKLTEKGKAVQALATVKVGRAKVAYAALKAAYLAGNVALRGVLAANGPLMTAVVVAVQTLKAVFADEYKGKHAKE